ncbi:MAG: hypothetical protein LBG91_02825 [Treponema sp.]|nr:hypothetical protein [Treponema sp.]
MKKVSLVVMERERELSLEKLREAGVLHPERKGVSSDTLSALLDKKSRAGKALGILQKYPVNKSAIRSDTGVHAGLTDHVLNLADEKRALGEQLVQNAKERRRLEPWGDFDPHSFAFLEENGITLIPYELTRKEYDSLDPELKLIVVSRDKRGVRAFAVGAPVSGFSPFTFPGFSISQIDEKVTNINLRMEKIEQELASLASSIKDVEVENSHLLEEIEFETANAGMENREDAAAVSWLCGFVPVDKLGVLKRSAAEYGWALQWDDPSPEDKPPTLVKSNALVRIIQPLFSFLGTVPGYKEYDISPSYLLFFSLFFAMIFGDAAYGTILFFISIAGGIAFKKKSGRFPDAAKLFMLLSFCTIVWGSITGSWFAIPVESLPPVLRLLIIPPFNNSGPLVQFPPLLQMVFNLPAEVPIDDLKTRWNIQFLCFTVGATQLIWARGKNVIKQLPSLTALAQAGWLVMMLGLYFLVLFMLLGVPLPSFATRLIAIGAGLYFIFAEQKGGNFFKNVGKSFANFLSIFLNVVGSFADIISYIRLFAVGLAGSAIAGSFNDMAIPQEGFGTGAGFVLRLIPAVLILVFGHALNMVMNALSVIVHGVRLNLLEYAGNHLGMEWSGYKYKPFALKKR